MDAAIEKEIRELHEFFAAWFRGDLENEDEVFARCAAVMAEDFFLIGPGGILRNRDELLGDLRAAHGCRPASYGRFEIWTTDLRIRPLGDGRAMALYEEHQRRGEETTRRISTAVFIAAPDAPNGVLWEHVHETWLDRP